MSKRTNYPEPVQKEIEKLEAQICRVAADSAIVEELLAVVAESGLPTESKDYGETYAVVSTGYEFGAVQGPILVVHDAQDIRIGADFLRSLKRHGFRLEKRSDIPEADIRTWSLVRKEDSRSITLRVCLSWSGATCKFVQVGTREEPVYELRCGEATP